MSGATEGKKEMEVFDTSVAMKRKHWDQFVELIKNQWEFGGIKYGQNPSPGARESTDLLTECFGLMGLLYTMGKYLLRFRNMRQEKDILKLGCYCYILWLKMGHWKDKTHNEDIGPIPSDEERFANEEEV